MQSITAVPGNLQRLQALPSAGALRAAIPLQDLHRRAVLDLLRNNRDSLEVDPNGEPVVRSEAVLITPAPATVEAAVAQGFQVLREQSMDELGLRSVVLRPPRGASTLESIARLRRLDATLQVDFNHIYTRSGSVEDSSAASQVFANEGSHAPRRVGIIDGGVDANHPSLRNVEVNAWGCDGVPVASPHGTAVASLLVGNDGDFNGVALGAVLYSADIYCGKPTGGSAETVAMAMAWMAREHVAVINVSLVGPDNKLMEQAVRVLSSKGHVIVAAVGNDGPSAPPLFPASYPSAIGVTGVTPARRVLPEAAQGLQVAFAAPGADLAVAEAGTLGYVVARGTSFAAPVVAGLLSESLRTPDPTQARRALNHLVQIATDLGLPGKDPIFGYGLVGETSRIVPASVHATARGDP